MTDKPYQRYNQTIALAGGAYVAILFPAIAFIDGVPEGWPRYLVALLPVLPCLWGLWAVMRLVREVDEMWQKIYLEASAFALGVTFIATITVFFMQRLAGLPHIDLIWIAVFSICAFFAGLWRARRKYDAGGC